MATDKWVYTGKKLKALFQRRGISYKDAAARLGIDKNTVGKAVRGGNMNVDILLRICNEYGMPMTDFFAVEKENGADYLNSLSEEVSILEEECVKYKKCELSSDEIIELKTTLARTAALMQRATEEYQRCLKILDGKLKK